MKTRHTYESAAGDSRRFRLSGVFGAHRRSAGEQGRGESFRQRLDGPFGLLMVVLVSVLIELFFFNMSFFASLTYPDVESNYSIDGTPAAAFTGAELSAEDPVVEITGLDDDVRGIRFFIEHDDSTATDAMMSRDFQVTVSLTDEGNESYYFLPAIEIDPADPAGGYINLEPAGKCHSIRVGVYNLNRTGDVRMSDIAVNGIAPFYFDPIRFAIILIVTFLLFAVRPASRLQSVAFDIRRRPIAVTLIALVAVEMVVIVFATLDNTHAINLVYADEFANYFEYQKYAEALLQGHVYLDAVPSDALQAMPNPYDYFARRALKVDALWDHAYYQGRYYVYFGILPCLVFHVPWLAATGTAFPTWVGVIISLCVFAAGVAFLLYAIVRRWFPRTSVALFVILDITVFLAAGGMIPARTPTIYYLVEAFGMALVVWGLGLWIHGTRDGRIRMLPVIAGSFLFACTLATRPQMVLGAVFGLLLFVPFVRGVDSRRRHRAYGSFALAFLPFLIVGCAMMYYNMIRFGSPLDFGANYNLTTNDMTHRGFHINRIPYAMYTYLVQPPAIGSRFPFFHQTFVDSSYQGATIYEPMFGGYFFMYPMTIMLFALPLAWRRLVERKLAVGVVAALVLAIVLCIFDLQGAGVLLRYFCDFALYFALATAAVVLALTSMPDASTERANGSAALKRDIRSERSATPAVRTVSTRRLAIGFTYVTFISTMVAAFCLFDAVGTYM